ncbi:flagellin [Gluconacetobacter sacchari]|uniref:flagellin n=1 Tax=Gluconacetobacter sacchari TaxID=92759 RepID=UPI0039B5A9CB
MSSAINQYGGGAISLVLSAGIKSMTLEQESLTWQGSDGTLSPTYAGLGSARSTAISLSPKITQIKAWQSNITNAQTDLTVTASALNQLVSLAQSLATSLLSISGTTQTSTAAAVSEQAKGSLTELKTVLNTTSGANYVFSGTDTNTPTVSGTGSLSDSALATQISSIVGSLSTAGATSVMQQATAAAMPNGTNSVFAKSLSSVSATGAANLQRVTVTNNDSLTNVGIVATQSSTTSATTSAATGNPPTSTGSPISDLMRDMMIASSIGGMSSSTHGFSDMASQLYSSIETTISQLTELEASVGSTQDSLTAQSSLLTNVQSTLGDQLSDSTNADPATVATQISAIRLQLEASYTLVADMKNMTLANYI